MKAIPVSTFKTRCIAILQEVQRTREPVLITLRGKPLATVQPIETSTRGNDSAAFGDRWSSVVISSGPTRPATGTSEVNAHRETRVLAIDMTASLTRISPPSPLALEETHDRH